MYLILIEVCFLKSLLNFRKGGLKIKGFVLFCYFIFVYGLVKLGGNIWNIFY